MCNTRGTIAGNEKRLNIFERKASRKIHGLVYNPDTQVWDKRTTETVYTSKESKVIQFIGNVRLEWVGHVWRAENSIAKTSTYEQH